MYICTCYEHVNTDLPEDNRVVSDIGETACQQPASMSKVKATTKQMHVYNILLVKNFFTASLVQPS